MLGSLRASNGLCRFFVSTYTDVLKKHPNELSNNATDRNNKTNHANNYQITIDINLHNVYIRGLRQIIQKN